MSIDKISVEFNWRGGDAEADLYWNGKVGRLRVLLDGKLAASEDWMDWEDAMNSKRGVQGIAKRALDWAASVSKAQSLPELFDILQSPVGRYLDWTNLPTYGGAPPRDTREVWSWDEECVIAGSGKDLSIMTREYWDEIGT